ncbi:MAG TPA: preprotein translocase subunit YajC [Mycobacteriales bacterium]|nr:preprotein translocase subunit YajC [Mycobacteriales bacterium]HWA65999.1 preprotein translocase subunit YajC [Mycobacteriales bacterium]
MHASLLARAVLALPAASSSGGSTSGGSSAGGSSFAPFLLLIVLFFLAYLLFIRPARNRQRAAVESARKAAPGDEIITTSGLLATVVEVNDDALTLEIAPGIRVRYVPAAILRVLGDEPEEGSPDVTNHEVIEEPENPPDPTDGPTGT